MTQKVEALVTKSDEFSPQDSHDRRRELTPTNNTHTVVQMYLCTH